MVSVRVPCTNFGKTKAGYGYGTLTVLKQEDSVLKYGSFEVTGFHRFP